MYIIVSLRDRELIFTPGRNARVRPVRFNCKWLPESYRFRIRYFKFYVFSNRNFADSRIRIILTPAKRIPHIARRSQGARNSSGRH
jgi:hypothetical protein